MIFFYSSRQTFSSSKKTEFINSGVKRIIMKKGNYTQVCWVLISVLLMLTVGCSGTDGGSDTPPTAELFTISGTITAPNNVAIDSDVNDEYVPPVSNDYFDGDDAQVLPNPVILGGFVNQMLTGDSRGNSYFFGDQSDVFQVTLTENETVTLYIADYTTADLDLYLYGENPDPNVPLDSSTGWDTYSESLQAPSAGTYYIEVYAYSGASNYVLSTGQITGSATVMDERLEDEFIPGDIIVRFKENAKESLNRSLLSKDTAILGLKHKAGVPERKMLMGLDTENKERVFKSLNIVPTEQNRQLFQTTDPEDQLKLDTLRAIEALKKRPDVVYAEPNYIRKAFAVPTDEHYAKQWHYPLINLPEAWEITKGSSDVIVAVVDTGILSTHPDINSSQLVDGYDFIRSTDISVDGDGVDSDPDDPGDQMQGGSSFHGTHVAGTIAAATNNTTGVSGVAWNCKIMPLRALGKGGGSSYDIMQAVRYAAGLTVDANVAPSNAAHIINLSLGGASFSQSEQDDINAVRAAGVIIIAAAGNEDTSDPSYPAAYDGVISVSAVGADKSLAPYSNYGSKIDIAAPGGDMSQDLDGDGHPDGVLSTSGDDSSGTIQMIYEFSNGTSMAAPHMAGVAALMKSVYSDLTPNDLDSLIQNGNITEDIGPTGRDDSFGYGLINAQKAVIEAHKLDDSATAIPALLAVTPLTLNFESSRTPATVTAKNLGDEALTGVSPSEDADWLTVTADTVDAEGLGTYTVTVLDNDLDNGPYTADITFSSSQNTVTVSVSMIVGQTAVAGNAGFHYILLINPDTFEAVDQFEVPTPSGGKYSYSLQAPAGTYILFAGTDSDSDYYIGDSGESSGAYISMDQPVEITLDQNVTYDFTTTFNINLPTASSADNDASVSPIVRNEKYKISK